MGGKAKPKGEESVKKPVFMGTTQIDPQKTVGEIMAVLVASGARQIDRNGDQSSSGSY